MDAEKPVTPTEEQLEILEYNFCKKWFKQRLAQWRKSEGLPSESGSVRD